ncbi:MAG: ATP synthase F1 subunit gamma [Spirochaetes bacterium]|nr:ATP synthase F1 subunit gamma [Spirochaetota bacterium]
MANQRDIRNRIKSISNTKKITSTMEMVSTAKMKKMQVRLEQSKPYENKVNEIITNLISTGVSATLMDPHFREVSDPSRILILTIAGNRGLCGSFNTNIIEKSLNFKDKLVEEGKEVLNYVIGKKGINFMNFIKEPMYKSAPNPEDKITFDTATKIGNELRQLFISGEVHEVYIAYTKVVSSSSQKPEIIRLLPIPPDEEVLKDPTSRSNVEYIFEPNPARIFSYLLPLFIKVRIFTCFLESAFSEQFSRRVAMKNATDASGEMIRELTISYNRARQAKITNEIAEIVGGAAALE